MPISGPFWHLSISRAQNSARMQQSSSLSRIQLETGDMLRSQGRCPLWDGGQNCGSPGEFHSNFQLVKGCSSCRRWRTLRRYLSYQFQSIQLVVASHPPRHFLFFHWRCLVMVSPHFQESRFTWFHVSIPVYGGIYHIYHGFNQTDPLQAGSLAVPDHPAKPGSGPCSTARVPKDQTGTAWPWEQRSSSHVGNWWKCGEAPKNKAYTVPSKILQKLRIIGRKVVTKHEIWGILFSNKPTLQYRHVLNPQNLLFWNIMWLYLLPKLSYSCSFHWPSTNGTIVVTESEPSSRKQHLATHKIS